MPSPLGLFEPIRSTETKRYRSKTVPLSIRDGSEQAATQEQSSSLGEKGNLMRPWLLRHQQHGATQKDSDPATCPDRRASIPTRLAEWRRQTFRALRMRNYRLFFVGQVISRAGWWMQMVAENWLVVDLGGSGLILGMTSALQFAPLLLLSAYAGVLVDRRETRPGRILTPSGSG